MSLFLGKIHYWLYEKIRWFEGLEEALLEWAKKEGLPTAIGQQARANYGEPTGGRPLEEIIDTSNIHGWLQHKINCAELRQAYIVTAILKENYNYISDLVHIFAQQGEIAATNFDGILDIPKEVYQTLNDYILEGMPCDRVDQVVKDDANAFEWVTSRCLHSSHWEEVGGQVEHFYTLREAWVQSFVRNLEGNFEYKKEGNRHHIKKL